jgi:DNA polymerase III subunit gamma/tau
MDQVFYRKYRPVSFSDVKGQEHVVGILKQSLTSGNLSHAYLFSGPRGTGKTSIARILAKAINCLNFDKNQDACNECENCKLINSGAGVDIIEMDAASNRGIEDIRSLRDSINYVPAVLKRKVYIIDEAHMLTKEAFNALLKTLEEPPQHVLFILATTEAHKLPITILSRVQRYDFRLANDSEIIDKLDFIAKSENIPVDRNILEIIYKQSGGSYRDAESLFSKVILSTKFNGSVTSERIYEILGLLPESDLDEMVSLIESGNFAATSKKLRELVVKGIDISLLIDQMLLNIKNRIIIQNAVADEKKQLINLIQALLDAKKDLKFFTDKVSVFEFALIKYFFENLDAETDLSMDIKPRAPQDKRSRVKLEQSSEKDLPNEEPEIAIEDGNPNEESVTSAEKKLPTAQIDGVELIRLIEQSSNSANQRLKAIFRTSDIIQEQGVFIIQNRYKFNLDYISKVEIKALIRKALEHGNFEVVDIRFEKVDELSGGTGPVTYKNKNEAMFVIKEESNLSETKDIEETIEESGSKAEESDNSDLVESIL